MRVVKGLARPADAYQFLKETEEQLAGLVLQTGPVTVQREDQLNRIPGRCYVPTTWGAAVLEYGDWFVVYDIGVVSAFNDAQFRLLFEFDDSATLFEVIEEPEPEPELEGMQVAEARRGTSLRDGVELMSAKVEGAIALDLVEQAEALPMPEMAPALRFRAMSDGATWLPSFQAFCDRYRLDYVVEAETAPRGGEPDFRVKVGATGREVVSFGLGELLDCYPDGRVVTVPEAAEA